MKKLFLLTALACFLIGTSYAVALESSPITSVTEKTTIHVTLVYDASGAVAKQVQNQKVTTVRTRADGNSATTVQDIKTVYEFQGGSIQQTTQAGTVTTTGTDGTSTKTTIGVKFNYDAAGKQTTAEGTLLGGATSTTTGTVINNGVKESISRTTTDVYGAPAQFGGQWVVTGSTSTTTMKDFLTGKNLSSDVAVTTNTLVNLGGRYLASSSITNTTKSTWDSAINEGKGGWVAQAGPADYEKVDNTYAFSGGEYRLANTYTTSHTYEANGGHTDTVKVLNYARNEATGVLKSITGSYTGTQTDLSTGFVKVSDLNNYALITGNSVDFGVYIAQEDWDWTPR